MKRVLALILCIAYAVLCVGCADQTGKASGILATPEYPAMAPYPSMDEFISVTGELNHDKWSEAEAAYTETLNRQRQYASGCEGLDAYFTATARELLSKASEENLVYSPVNLYLALGMLAEITDHASRQQSLALLSEESIDDVRAKCHALWNACYRDTGSTTSIPASSIWLQDDYPYNTGVLRTLAEKYYASSYSGEMGTEEYTQQLQNWLDENTHGLLSDACKEIQLSRDTRIALATTLYFCARWSAEFSENETAPRSFHLPGADSATVECDFMHQSSIQNYYWGERFSAVKQDFKTGGGMWFILPDEGTSVSDLASDSEAMDFILSGGDWENSKHLIVNFAVPKFDVSSTVNLSEAMKQLRVTDVFDIAVSDFTPLTDEPLFLSEATHSARVKIDEEGCEAAAFTVMLTCGSAMPPSEEVDFILDRPFLFVITGDSGLPLFMGIVNHPQ